jgi:hypothetical protein
MARGTQVLRGTDCTGTLALSESRERIGTTAVIRVTCVRQHTLQRDAARSRQGLPKIEQQLRVGAYARAMPIDIELDEHRHTHIGRARCRCKLLDCSDVVGNHLEAGSAAQE